MTPSISVREHIRWLPDRESEPTSTLVLTSAGQRFVDIRILKPQQQYPLEPFREDVLPISRLDWAFAGTSSSEIRHSDDDKAFTHSTWHHEVDSKTPPQGEPITDEGDMFPQPDGGTLEKGAMVNPATGRLTEYEELWNDVAAKVVGQELEKETKCCVVLHLRDDEHRARGMVVRVGQYVQGLIRVGEQLSLERWEWLGREDGWKRAARMGDLWLPCAATIKGSQIEEGGEVKFGDYMWRVVELSYF